MVYVILTHIPVECGVVEPYVDRFFDPNYRLKAIYITLLMQLKREAGLEDHIYKCMYSTGCCSPKFYDLPKTHKANTPLDP